MFNAGSREHRWVAAKATVCYAPEPTAVDFGAGTVKQKKTVNNRGN